jgi:ribosomal protein S27AE
MKTCFKCGDEKPRSEFYKNRQMADGLLGKCKECAKRDSRDRGTDPVYEKKRNALPHRVAAREAYAKTEAGKDSQKRSKNKWASKNAIKKGASTIIGNAVRDGRLKKSHECSECGCGGRIHGHHDNYSLPMVVRWLCSKCHHQWHIETEKELMDTKDEEVLVYRAIEALEAIADSLNEMNERQREKDEFSINHKSFGAEFP